MASLMDLRCGSDGWGDFIAYPLIDKRGKVVGYQKIYDCPIYGRQSNKHYLFKPNSKKGCFALIGQYEIGKPLYIAEGLATALTVHFASGYPCVIALDAGNLEPVMANLKALDYQKLIVTADNDQKNLIKNGNTGLYKAVLAVREHGGRVFLPLTPEAFEEAKLADKTVFDVSRQNVLSANGEPCNFDFNDLLKIGGVEAVKAQLKLSSNRCEVAIARNSLDILLQDLPIMPQYRLKKATKKLLREMVRRAPFKPLETVQTYVKNKLPDSIPVDFTPLARMYAEKRAEAMLLFTFQDELPTFELSANLKEMAKELLKRGGVYLDNRIMGAGKTNLLVEVAEQAGLQNLSFGYIAHRISLIANACKRLGIDSYEQLTSYDMDKVQAMGICINSIEKEYFRWFFEQVDVLSIDEIRQVLEHIAVGSLDKSHRELIHDLLLRLVENAWLVIGSDADVDQKTLDFLKKANRPIQRIVDANPEINKPLTLNKTLHYGEYYKV